MDRFIGCPPEHISLTYRSLKSNMDRFIAGRIYGDIDDDGALKSNMDRFIETSCKAYAR